MPSEVITRAERVLKKLEEAGGNDYKGEAKSNGKKVKGKKRDSDGVQLSFFKLDDPLLETIRDELNSLDINTLSPLDAFDKLRQIKKRLGI